MNIVNSLTNIKKMLEASIISGGTVGKRNLIRTSKPINEIHELIKHDLLKLGASNILPKISETNNELALQGFLKKKKQDIVILPDYLKVKKEFINELGVYDNLGFKFSERVLSINVRSQLSSVAKNFDTIFERTYAESFNLHQRLNNIVLGEVFLLSIREFDDTFSDKHEVKYRDLGPRVENQIQKYVNYFNLINKRCDTKQDFHKYERVCLLLVDFSRKRPKIYQTKKQLIEDGILSDNSSLENFENLNYDNLYKDIFSVYKDRFHRKINNSCLI